MEDLIQVFLHSPLEIRLIPGKPLFVKICFKFEKYVIQVIMVNNMLLI